MNIILFGFISSGKTFFGKKLSQKINRPFLDTDELIIERYAFLHHRRQSVRQIYQCLGENAFRRFEDETVQALHPDVPSVIVVGGGTMLNPQNAARLRDLGRLVYLAAGFDTVRRRIFVSGLPSFIDAANPLFSLEKIYRERIVIYESIQAVRIDVDKLDETKIIEELVHGI